MSKFVLRDKDEERYLYTLHNREIEFVKRQKYAKTFRSFDDAEYTKRRAMMLDITLHLTVEEVEIPKCNMDCFNCPLEDCTATRPTRTAWEQKAIAAVLGE